MNVTKKGSDITPIPKVEAEKEVVPWGKDYDLTDNIKDLPEGATVEDVTPPNTIDTKKSGPYTGQVKVTFKGGATRIVDVPVEVQKSNAETYNPQGQDIPSKIGDKPSASDGIKNKEELPGGTDYTWEDEPNTDEPGDKQGKVKVEYPDGSSEIVDVTVKVEDNLKLTATPKTQTVIEGKDIKDITAKVNKDGAVITNDQGLTVDGKTLTGKAPKVTWKDDNHESEDVTVTITATVGEGEKAETITDTVTITVQRDTDGDGDPDVTDPDDDNDGIKDEDDKNPKVADNLTLEATPKTQTVIEGQDIKDITAKVNKDGAVITNDQGLTVDGKTLTGKAPKVTWKDDNHESEDVTVTITATVGEGEKAETITDTVTITVQRDTDGDGDPDVTDPDDDNDG
ncbi:hypothetical protein BA93_07470, partial [Finegoldia magna ALB8]|uniref:Rib/alpha-like domain-containing protein n=1 Tax=Finegoldia magna TaxID=1260 RepID=UPI00044EAB43